ncbi:hypothetical protein, partial [Segatella copri]|uniref:hypothetical protein n=1 Tax=Segatella copri TaxID=165179 RepID=UPI003F88DE26
IPLRVYTVPFSSNVYSINVHLLAFIVLCYPHAFASDPFFGYNSETNNVMRIADHKIANEMMEILYSATENKVNGG